MLVLSLISPLSLAQNSWKVHLVFWLGLPTSIKQIYMTDSTSCQVENQCMLLETLTLFFLFFFFFEAGFFCVGLPVLELTL